jgi:outer membrane protein OmpA-like peptidoglycan-associated protein
MVSDSLNGPFKRVARIEPINGRVTQTGGWQDFSFDPVTAGYFKMEVWTSDDLAANRSPENNQSGDWAYFYRDGDNGGLQLLGNLNSKVAVVAPSPPPAPAPPPPPPPAPTPPPPAPAPTAGMQIQETATEVKVMLLGDILFDFDRDDLRPEAIPTLGQVATIIQKYPTGSVLIEGYTDSKGSADYNQKLSERRASSVMTWLIANGIPKAMLSTRGWGAEHPVASNTYSDGSDYPDGRQKNRRVEVTIHK